MLNKYLIKLISCELLNRDWDSLVAKCLGILNKDGVLYFSTNSRRLKFEEEKLPLNEDGSPKQSTGHNITNHT